MPLKGKGSRRPQKRMPIRVHKLVKTPRPGGDRRGPQTQSTTSHRNISPGYKRTSTLYGRKALQDLRDGGATFVQPKKVKKVVKKGRTKPSGLMTSAQREAAKRRMELSKKHAAEIGYTGGPTQWHIDHGFASGQMSKVSPVMQAQKQAILRSGGVPIWNDELNRWVTL